MRNIRDEYDQSIALLKCREEEIRLTKTKLDETERDLLEKENQLLHVTQAFEQEVIVSQAHQATEQSLNSIAINLRNVAAQSLADVGGLFEKLGQNI